LRGYTREKIWDPVTRLWHWILALAVCLGWSFGKFMSFSTIQWHFYCGYLIIGLMMFRLVWGFCGPQPIRYRAFLPNPRRILNYLKSIGERTPSGIAGHSPIGALSVLAIVGLLIAQATTGLFIVSDDFFESGPLAHLVSEAVNNRCTWWHKLLSKAVLGIVVLHLSAIFFYLLWKKENLIQPMISGWKWVKLTKDNST
jgi:cytochrome b